MRKIVVIPPILAFCLVVAASWYGICAPAGLPKPVLAKFNADLVRVLSGGTLRQRLEEQGVEVTPSTPEQFVAHVRSETAKWAKVVKEANLGPE